ncbi:MAG: DUF11 domain-containing protein [Peptostreptococcaceae bacterium]
MLDVKINSIPLEPTAIPTVTKSVDKVYTVDGEILIYTITVKNNDVADISNVYLLDTLPSCETFIENSVTINGVTQIGASINQPSSIAIASIYPGSISVVTFETLVYPSPCNMESDPYIEYTNSSGLSNYAYSNNEFLPITQQESCLSVIKSVDKSYASLGDTLTYTFIITNNCTSSVFNSILTDKLSPCLEFVPHSVTLNNIGLSNADPQTGIATGTIPPGQSRIIAFKVTVIKCPCTAQNSASVRFYITYSGIQLYIDIPSNVVSTTISCPTTLPLKIKQETCNCINCLGQKIPYSIKVTNISSSVINNIIVDDIIPLGTYISSTTVSNGNISQLNGKLTWTIPSLQPGSNVTSMMIMIATDNICFDNKGYIINTATIVSYNSPPIITNISDTSISYVDCFCCN